MVLVVIMSIIQSLFHNFMNSRSFEWENLSNTTVYGETWFIFNQSQKYK